MSEPTRVETLIAPACWDLGAAYGLIAELLVNPEFRDKDRIDLNRGKIAGSAPGEIIEDFLASPASRDVDEYTQTLELSPPCPLYFGAYMYEEPSSCRGAGASGRNAYMIELAAVYAHFGLELGDSELPDYVPVALEFLAISIERSEHDGIGLRRRLLDTLIQPGIAPLRKALQKYECAYDMLFDALQLVVEEDLERMSDDPIWLPPEVEATIPQRREMPESTPQQTHGRKKP
ncbi:nitrate reductase molybdenum cofactor assembly chaperone [Rhodovulum imhoffii]|nr:molecular chaperone TorD family protein [Rhodovulum imhoffii]